MTQPPRTSRLVPALLLTASAGAMLMACDGRSTLDSILGDDRSDSQVADFNRHRPALNPRPAPAVGMMPAPSPQGMMAQPPQPPAAPAEITPYDRYVADDSGSISEVSEDEARVRLNPNAPQQPQQSGTVGSTFRDWFGSWDEESPAPAGNTGAAASAPGFMDAPRPEGPRKSLQGNPRPTLDTEPTAPQTDAAPVIAPEPVKMMPTPKSVTFLNAPEASAPAREPEPSPAPQAVADYETAQAAPAPEPAFEPIRPVVEGGPVQPPVQRRSFFSRMMSPFYGSSDEPMPAQAPTPATPAEGFDQPLSYPELSSVPSTPQQFKAVKSEQQERMEELQGDHINAMQAQQQLMSEPSEQAPEQAPAPVMLLGEGVSAMEMGTGEDAPAPAPVPAAVATPAAPEEEVLLGHASQPPEMTNEAEAAPVLAAPQQQPAPVAIAPVAPAPIPVKAAPRSQTLDAQLAGFKSPKKSQELQPQVVPVPAPQPVPVPVVAEAPEEAVADEPQAVAPSSGALPSVKLLPPSRYQSRARTMPRPATTY